MQGIYYRSGAHCCSTRISKGGWRASKQLFFLWGGELVFTNHHTTLPKIKDFNDLVFFFIKMKKLKEKFKNLRVWETRIINS